MAEKKPGNQVVPYSKNEIALSDMAGLEDVFGGGVDQDSFEHLDGRDASLPRISLLNFNSELVKDEEKEALKAGIFISSLDEFPMNSGTNEHLQFMVLFQFKTRLSYWPEGSGAEGIRCISNDFVRGQGDPGGTCSTCDMKEFVKNNDGTTSAPECSEVINFACLFPEHRDGIHDVGVLSFRKTGIADGKKLIKLLVSAGGKPYQNVFQIGSRKETAGKRSWLVPELKPWAGMNRLDLRVTKRFADLGPEGLRGLLEDCAKQAQVCKSLREIGKIASFDSRDNDSISAEEAGIEMETIDVDPSDAMDWGDSK